MFPSHDPPPLVEILNSDKKVLFIRNLLDCKVLDEVHAKYLSNELQLDPKCNDIVWLHRLKDLLTKKYKSLDNDLLIIHYGQIKEEVKKEDIIYKKMSEKQRPINWDYWACMEAIKELNKMI